MRRILLIGLFLLGVFALKAQTRIYCLAGDTLNLNVENFRGSLQWQLSLDSLNWTDIVGATESSIDYLPTNGQQWVRTEIDETNCPLFFSSPIFISTQDTSLLDFDNTIVVMDTVLVEILPDSLEQAGGVYSYLTSSGDPGIMAGDIIVGTTGYGYLRFVEYAIVSDTNLVLHTSQATLDDLFDDASFSFDLANDSLDERSTGLNHTFEQTTLLQDGPLTLTLESGSLGMTGDWHGDLEYSILNGLNYFYYGTNNGLLDVNFNINLNATQQVSLIEDSIQFPSFEMPYLVYVGNIPVNITLEADLIAKYSVELSAGVDYNFNYTSSLALITGITYSNGEWSNGFDLVPSQSLSVPSPTGQVQASFNFSIVPKLRMKIYSVAVPYIHPSAHLDVIGSLALTGNDWDITAEAYAGVEMGLNFEILGDTLPLFTPIIAETPILEVYKTPYIIEMVSGNNQVGIPGEQLPEPARFRVLDQWGESQENVFVYLQITSGDGLLSADTLITDENGECEVLWSLGTADTLANSFIARAFDGSSEDLINSPITVFASLENVCDSVFVDPRDGQSYEVVTIGDQCWFAENLRYGGEIPQVSGNANWAAIWNNGSPTQQPAWCYYDDNAGYDAIYGKLYNWYAVNTNTLCPIGWHIPSYADWTALIDFLGGESVAGGKMKSITGWSPPNTDATNISGFSGLPGGLRLYDFSYFSSVDIGGYWWSSSEIGSNWAWSYVLGYNSDDASVVTPNKNTGQSCRCLRD